MQRREFMLAGAAVSMAGWAEARAAVDSGAKGSAAVAKGASMKSLPPKFAPVHDILAKQVAEERIPGAVWMIARGDDVTVDTLGVTAVGGKTPMARDTIFRIASMTKAITATAVLMLIEEGKLSLDAPAERWLPELANRRVLRKIDGPLGDTEPARRAITVKDLLTFTHGFGMLFDPNAPINKAVDQLQLVNGPPVPMTPHHPDEWMRRFSTLPLMHQPGARWMYNTGSLLQGVLVRRAARQDFDVFVEERILAPLGMRDTGFFVPASKLDRFAGCGVYTDAQSGAKTRMDKDGAESAYTTRPVFPSGAGGLVSTVDDYLAFARMLLAHGAHKGKRLLSEHSVRTMTSNQLTREQIAASDFFPHFFDAHGWGYGLSPIIAPDAVSRTPGRYGWDGGFGTSWSNDPTRNLVSVVMTQSADFLFSGALDQYWQAVYAAVG